MKQTWWKISVVVILLVAIVAVIAQKQQKQVATPQEPLASSTSSPTTQTALGTTAPANTPVKSGDVCPTPAAKTQAKVPDKSNIVTNAPKMAVVPEVKPVPKTLPKLVDVGATECIPCKMMAPILDELAVEYKDKMVVEFVNINEQRELATRLGVQAIPTQIFYDKNGKEFARHLGFLPKEEILKAFTKQGIKFAK